MRASRHLSVAEWMRAGRRRRIICSHLMRSTSWNWSIVLSGNRSRKVREPRTRGVVRGSHHINIPSVR